MWHFGAIELNGVIKMKHVLLLLTTSFILQIVEAVPHSHAGRAHDHALPVAGVQHRHGSGAIGSSAQQNSQEMINASSSGWLSDQKGCLHFDDFWKPDGTGKVTWTGGCLNGKATGKGTLRHIKNGIESFKYIGPKKEGYNHGRGKMVWGDGDVYIGEIKKGKKHGKGTYYFSGKSCKRKPSELCRKKFVGKYKDDKHSYGKMTYYKTNNFYEGSYTNNKRVGKLNDTVIRERNKYDRTKNCQHVYVGRVFEAKGGILGIKQQYKVLGFSSSTGKVTVRPYNGGSAQEGYCSEIPE